MKSIVHRSFGRLAVDRGLFSGYVVRAQAKSLGEFLRARLVDVPRSLLAE